MFWTTNSNVIAMIILIASSVIVIGIISVYLKFSESKGIKIPQKPIPGFTHQLSNNVKNVDYEEEKYRTLANTLHTSEQKHVLHAQENIAQIPTYSITEQIKDNFRAKYVVYEGKKFRVRRKSLKLRNKKIKNITDIQGLDMLWRLKKLNLSNNQITIIDGIEHLVNLRVLKLSANKIHEIGYNLHNLKKLKKLYLDKNQLKEVTGNFPINLNYINIARNPIKKFEIYSRDTYKKIHFGPMKWFPKEEIIRMKKLTHRRGYRAKKISMSRLSKAVSVTIVIMIGLPFLFPFIFIHAIANTLAIDYLQAVINYYSVVTIYTNLIYYGIIGFSFLAGALGGLIGEDSGMILPVSICFIVLFVILFPIVGYPICNGFAQVWFG